MSDNLEQLKWTVTPGDLPSRLDQFLVGRGKLGTRSQIQQLIRQESVSVDGVCVKAGARLRAGQVVCVARPQPVPTTVAPEKIELDVLYEDDSILVLNKPPGLVVHPAPGHWSGTLVNALLYRWGAPGEGLDPLRPGIVHRLDKDTSGVMVVAKSVQALAHLAKQFRSRQVEKQYLALAWGRFRRPSGVIRERIGRDRVNRKRMTVHEQGREALTRYEVLEDFGVVSLVRARPETGRTHQIRVHLAAAGHPICADAAYSRGRGSLSLPIARQALHAESIRFRHPGTGDALCMTAPLPQDFAATLAQLREMKRGKRP